MTFDAIQSMPQLCERIASDPQLFGWGCVGGFASFMLAAAMPELIERQRRNETLRGQRIAIPVLLLIVFCAVGGFAALMTGDRDLTYKHAILLGLGWSVLLPSAARLVARDRNGPQQEPPGSIHAIS